MRKRRSVRKAPVVILAGMTVVLVLLVLPALSPGQNRWSTGDWGRPDSNLAMSTMTQAVQAANPANPVCGSRFPSAVPEPVPPQLISCEQYAEISVTLAKMNVDLQHGGSGGGWTLDSQAHLGFCRNVGLEGAAREAHSKAKDLWGTRVRRHIAATGKQAFCSEYARCVVEQTQANEAMKCGFGGGRWEPGYESPNKWCMERADHEIFWPINEARERFKLLDQCRK